jgi:hypothetical protein
MDQPEVCSFLRFGSLKGRCELVRYQVLEKLTFSDVSHIVGKPNHRKKGLAVLPMCDVLLHPQ